MRPAELLTSLLLFSGATSAWMPGWGPVGDLENAVAPMERRQDTSKFDLSFSGVQGNTATTEASTKETSTNSDDKNAETTNTADETGDASSGRTTGSARRTGTSTGSGTKTTGKSKTYDARLPAGGVSMITPNALSTQYYKIEDFVTFVWNYTSLSATPSKIDVLASCATNNQLYTISSNVSVEETQSIIWDTGAFQSSATVPLLTETYTLIIHDAAKDISAAPQAGYLGVANQFTFGMYTPKPYVPLNEFKCVTCNSADALVERQTLLALVGMASLTAISFGWFTGVAGLW
ncbi:uncharacterized protein RCC_01608 [Ramularia collo-cygni]|uniref:DUF7137 domain-containing protein n=1 Tax=Ramularia collo-cygni TaxID=112498 RepID=A0A2D3UZY5_9PEZI|nr:uncharacterized protein RCC_01608 [Ramularia collo-cygni]CZT15774.1 uncharacterized protein RCC_01608 [Ramularia collo-cygni]